MTLITYGTRSYFKNEFSIGLFILIFMQIMFLLGFIKNTFNENEKFGNLDVWYQAAYLTGLFLPLLSIGAIIINSVTSLADEFQYWWVGGLTSIFASAFYILLRKDYKVFNEIQIFSEARSIWLWEILKFEWLFKAIRLIEENIEKIINGFSGLLEGEGGILWSLVLLLLLLTVLG
jgi:hypothetical protein